MKVIVIVKGNADYEAGKMPDPGLLEAMTTYNEELVKAGIMLAGEGLKPTRDSARVIFSGSDRRVVDGPFAETRELIAGFWLWQVRDMDEAKAWALRCPNPIKDGVDTEIDIRPIFGPEDFAEIDPTGEIMEREARMRATLGQD